MEENAMSSIPRPEGHDSNHWEQHYGVVITALQARVLNVLHTHEFQHTGILARKTGMLLPNLGSVLKALRKKGLVVSEAVGGRAHAQKHKRVQQRLLVPKLSPKERRRQTKAAATDTLSDLLASAIRSLASTQEALRQCAQLAENDDKIRQQVAALRNVLGGGDR